MTICIIRRCLHGYKPSNKNFAPVKNEGFRWTNIDVHKLTATLNKKLKFD